MTLPITTLIIRQVVRARVDDRIKADRIKMQTTNTTEVSKLRAELANAQQERDVMTDELRATLSKVQRLEHELAAVRAGKVSA